MHRTRLEIGWSAAATLGALSLSACLFGGDQDLPPPAGPDIAHNAPKPGWYKGDYGELAQFGLESEIILGSDTSFQFIGILDNFAKQRNKGNWSASESVFIVSNHALSRPVDSNFLFDSLDAGYDPLHSGIFNRWIGLSDSTYPIRVFQDGSFERKEYVLGYFDVDTGSIPAVVKSSPHVWVRYRPAAMESIAAGRFEYREMSLLGSAVIPGLYRDIDFRGCDAGKFASRFYVLNDEVRIAWIPPILLGWWGLELEALQWSRLGSFLVAGNFRERIIAEVGTYPWVGSSGEYLMRVIPYGGDGLVLGWNDFPGYWAGLQLDTASCPAPPRSPATLLLSAPSSQ